MASGYTPITLRSELMNVTLDMSRKYAAGSDDFTLVAHRDEEIESYILAAGRTKEQPFAQLVKDALEDGSATLLQDQDMEVAGRAARFLRQRERGADRFIHLVLIIRYGERGAGLLLRGVYPEEHSRLERDIEHMLLSAVISAPGASAGEPAKNRADAIPTCPELKEAMSCPLEVVELNLWNKPLKVFPPEILKMKNLETLHLGEASLRELPGEIARLKKLKHLDISHNPLRTLPAEIGQLKRLEVLDAGACELTSVPASIGGWRSLKDLRLSYNRLSTLPSAIGRLKNLQRLALVDNPFTSLPQSLRQLSRTKIEIDQRAKALYCDISYRARAPKRAIKDADLYARHHEGLAARMDAAFADRRWAPYRGALRHCALRAIGLRSLKKDRMASVGNSRLGGFPDLPPEQPYPSRNGKAFTFLAQIDLEEIAGLSSFLPRRGWLYFFIEDLESFNPVVLHHAGPKSRLRPHERPEMDYCDRDHEGYPAFTVEFASYPSLPVSYPRGLFVCEHPKVRILKEHLGEEDDLAEAYDERLERLAAFTRMPYGNDIHSMNGYVFTQHESPQERAARAKGGWPEEWIVLLALGHDNNTRFNFWDAGTLYFLIHKMDLANLDFSNVHCGLESS